MSFDGRSQKRLGRYEVIGLLATGGMAEVHLGRLMGPSGFERVVVLKRILPHLAREPQFVDMFLDEARIAARIHHPNVVQVTDLGRDGDELYLTMEFVEGESLGSFMRRHWTRKLSIGRELAAFIVAEACAGLHAAHELIDEDGRSLQIVHRDVSPQNIMITYSGQVKVLDFGIAKAVDRATQTRTGQLKGKVEYMSPEQVRTEPVDRRSDVFSLGIILYELALGMRLFRRGGELAALRAVSEDPIATPSEVDPVFPTTLSAICMRALSRDKTERYASADELRVDLIGFLRGSEHAGLHGDVLGARMRELFVDRLQHKQELLRSLRTGRTPPALPAAEVDLGVEHPVVTVPAVSQSPRSAHERPLVELAGSQAENLGVRPGRAWLWMVPTALAAGVGILGLRLGFPARGSEVAADLEAQPSANATTTEPPPLVTALAGKVVIEVLSAPEGATVLLAGAESGKTPARIKVTHSESPLVLELRLDGYESHSENIKPDVDQRISLTLQKARAAAPPMVRQPQPAVSVVPSSTARYRKFN